MTIYSDSANGIVFLRPHHAVDYLVAQEIRERLAIAVNDGARSLILDFSLARLASAAILPIIVDAASQLKTRRGRIAIVGASPQFHRLLAISGVSLVAKEFTTAEEAQAHFGHHSDDKVPTSVEDNDDDDDFED